MKVLREQFVLAGKFQIFKIKNTTKYKPVEPNETDLNKFFSLYKRKFFSLREQRDINTGKFLVSFTYIFKIESLKKISSPICHRIDGNPSTFDSYLIDSMRRSRSTAQHYGGESSLLYKESNITTSHSFVGFAVPLDPHMDSRRVSQAETFLKNLKETL